MAVLFVRGDKEWKQAAQEDLGEEKVSFARSDKEWKGNGEEKYRIL